MYKLIALLLIAFTVADACRLPYCEYRPKCTSNRLCHTAGYFAYPYDSRLFYYCSAKWKNAACLRCPANLVFSNKCGQCLRKADAWAGRCSIAPPNTGSGSQSCVDPWACEDLEDGIQAVKDSETKFFFCENKKPTPCQSCPSGLIFSKNCKVCVRSETDCDTAGGPNGGSNGGQPTPLCAMNKFCWDLPAGWYNFPNNGEASREFFYCNDKFQNVGCQSCPANLLYSVKCGQCLQPKQAERDECFTAGGNGGGNGNGGNDNTDFCAPEGFCSGADAHGKPATFLFAVESDNTKFFSCVSGQATQCQSCAASLVFNQVCQACMRFKTDKSDECGAGQTGGPTDEGTGPSDNAVPRCDDLLCHGRAAGNYEQDSPSETYITCLSDGKCIKETCQNAGSGLFYSSVCGSCNFRYITDKSRCNEAPPTQPTTPRVSQCKEAATFCDGKHPDISYSPPAYSGESALIFYVCDRKGECFKKTCPPNLIYNDAIKGCDWPKKW